MSSSPPSDELVARAHQNLLDFLRTELELGFTFAKTAELEASMNNWPHFERARKYAEAAMETIHRFENQVTDLEALEDIRQRAGELQKRISALRVDRPNQGR